ARHLRPVQLAAVEVRRVYPLTAAGAIRTGARAARLPARMPGRRDGGAVGGGAALRGECRRPALCRGLLRPPPGARAAGDEGSDVPLGRLGARVAGAGTWHPTG